MKLYVIRKDSNIEIKSFSNCSTKDLKSLSDMRTATYYDEIASFDKLESAKLRFEEEKNLCNTLKRSNNGVDIYIFDDLRLVEEEYENEELIQELTELDRYIAEI